MPEGNELLGKGLHLDNPWTQLMYRQYQAKLKYSPPMIALNEDEILNASRTLEYLHSERTKEYIEAYPDKEQSISLRKKKTIHTINRNRAIVANHHAEMRSMREALIRFGFLDENGNPLFKLRE